MVAAIIEGRVARNAPLAVFSSGISKINWKQYLFASSHCKFKINNHSCLLIVFLQVAELQKELTLLAKSNQELEDKVELREPAHMEEMSWRSELHEWNDERVFQTHPASL